MQQAQQHRASSPSPTPLPAQCTPNTAVGYQSIGSAELRRFGGVPEPSSHQRSATATGDPTYALQFCEAELHRQTNEVALLERQRDLELQTQKLENDERRLRERDADIELRAALPIQQLIARPPVASISQTQSPLAGAQRHPPPTPMPPMPPAPIKDLP